MKVITIICLCLTTLCIVQSQKSLTECLYDGSIEDIQNKFSSVFEQIDQNEQSIRKYQQRNEELDKHLELLIQSDEDEQTNEANELNQTNNTNKEPEKPKIESQNSLKVFGKVPERFGFVSNMFKNIKNYVFGK